MNKLLTIGAAISLFLFAARAVESGALAYSGDAQVSDALPDSELALTSDALPHSDPMPAVPTAGAGEVVAKTLFSDGSTNTWTQADLVAALQLLNRKYHRDCESQSGRAAWHGKLVAQIVDTNREVKIERHADGKEFTFRWHNRKAADSVKSQLAKLKKRTMTTNGVPVALAAARQRIGEPVSNVTVRIEAGK